MSNITAGTKDQIQAVIDSGLIPPLIGLLATAEFDIKKEAAWAISNATSGGSNDQIKYLVQQVRATGLCPHAVQQQLRSGHHGMGTPAPSSSPCGDGWLALSLSVCPSAQGCIKPLCDLLTVADIRIITVALEGLENILKIGQQERSMPGSAGVNPYAQMIEDADGLDKVEHLQV